MTTTAMMVAAQKAMHSGELKKVAKLPLDRTKARRKFFSNSGERMKPMRTHTAGNLNLDST